MKTKKSYKKASLLLLIIFCLYNLVSAQGPIQLLMRADDMGKTYGRTLGIIKAHKEGIITSASLMPTSDYFEESVKLCKENPSLAIGIHLTIADITQRPVLSPELVPSLVTPNGFFYENAAQLKEANPRIDEIEKEIRAQIGKVRATGLNFVYLDWHRSVAPEVQEVIMKICKDEKLIYGQTIDNMVYGHKWISFVPESWPKQLLPDGQTAYYAAPGFEKDQQELFFNSLNNLTPGKYIVAVHPGVYEPQRASMTELLCSPRTKEIIKSKNINLISYYDLWKDEYGASK